MICLYVDNFRGFTKTLIPIKDVNFFVGENSTGKTSILGLISLLSSSQFWMSQDFDFNDLGFIRFSDIVSVNSKNKKYFTIGLISTSPIKNKDNLKMNSFMMTFIKKDGLPRLQVYTYNHGNKIIRVRLTEKFVKYKFRDFPKIKNYEDFCENIYLNWSEEHHTDKTGFSLLKIDLAMEVPVPILSSIIEDILLEKPPKRPQRISFSLPFFRTEIAWIAPIRTKPRRTYDAYKMNFSSAGDHTPYIINKIMDDKKESKEFLDYINRIGLRSGLYKGIKVNRFGKKNTAPFELDVVIGKNEISICCVGYGVSQSLPVIVESFMRPKGSWIGIQQPEVHLHPKAQAALGDTFFEIAQTEKKKFLIETHSDYMINRFRINYRKIDNKESLPDSQILFFERSDNGNKAYQLEINDNGDLPDNQPTGYRDFFIKEELDILGF
ncbi:AAA family ATPase [Desulfobacula sp.]|uniref:AAA family ATPase n=1 Tax=Desulfobacula sp. TaxID=2593537 RepID=UPI0026160AA1|nr:AAA family ATPase [Desulfobacula sp.]